MIAKLSKADRAISRFAGIAENLPNPHLLIDPFLRREAVLSSRIEGTQASLADVFFYEVSGSPVTNGDVRDVVNYVSALEYGLSRLSTLPICGRLLREIHERLLSDPKHQHLTPGQFRTSQNWIGPPGSTLNSAKYIPPSPNEMQNAISELEQFIHTPTSLPPLIRIALVHYQFEAIHPFLDGNGRIGRLLIALMLREEGLISQPLLTISAYFESHRSEYYERLMAVSLKGEWSNWIEYFLTAVSNQSLDAATRSKKLLDLQQQYRTELLNIHAPPSVMKLVDHLFSSPAITIARAAVHLHTSARTARIAVEKLQAAGILTESTNRLRGRVYVAKEITKILEEEFDQGE